MQATDTSQIISVNFYKWGRCVLSTVLLTAALLLLAPVMSAYADSYPHMRYNEVRQKMIHNAMDAEEPVLDMLTYHAVRGFEFDVHNTKGGTSLKGDWWVYHAGGVPLTVGSTVGEFAAHTAETLSDALEEIRTFHRHNPQHEVITFFIDQHDDFEAGRNAQDLDALIDRFFKFDNNLAKSEIFSPTHLFHSGDPKFNAVADTGPCPCPTLQDCVDGRVALQAHPACRWPLLSALRGKIIFVITGGNPHADEYVGFHGDVDGPAKSGDSQWLARRAFVTYDHDHLTSKPYNKTSNPYGFDRRPWEVFFNEDESNVNNVFTTNCNTFPKDCKKTMQRVITDNHLVGRSYDSDSFQDWVTQVKAGVQLIATDDVNDFKYDWAQTHASNGFPFECALTPGDGCGEVSEPSGSPIFSFDVISDDMNNNSDPDSFAFAEHVDARDIDYSLEVLAPESWTHDWAKACLMARENRSAKAAYFAVCRTANSYRIQIQWRPAQNDNGKAAGYDDSIDMDSRLEALAQSVSTGGYTGNGIPKDKAISFIKFTSSDNSKAFTAFASRDGFTWHHIYGPIQFKSPLTFKGIASTAHDTTHVLWRFEQFSIGGVFKDAGDARNWDYWLIGDGGNPVKASCSNGGCKFAHGDGNAQLLTFHSGWSY